MEVLKSLQGANIVEGTIARFAIFNSHHIGKIYPFIHTTNTVIFYRSFPNRTKFVRKTDIEKPPPPVNVTITKGQVHVIVRREFVDYVINDYRAKLFLDWVNDTGTFESSNSRKIMTFIYYLFY